MESHFEHTKQNHVQGKARKAPMFHERLIEHFEEQFLNLINNKTKSSVVALRKVIKTDVKRYGIVGFKDIKKLMINKMVEKPSVKSSPSQYAIIGRYVLNKSIFSFLTNQKSGKLGEIQITDAMNSMLIKEKFYGCKFSGKYLDCGTKEGYINSFIDINKKYSKKYVVQLWLYFC